jgi:hypothetical protein
VNRIVVKAGAPIVVKSAVKVVLADVLSQAVSGFIRSRLDAGQGNDGCSMKDFQSNEPPIPSGIS